MIVKGKNNIILEVKPKKTTKKRNKSKENEINSTNKKSKLLKVKRCEEIKEGIEEEENSNRGLVLKKNQEKLLDLNKNKDNININKYIYTLKVENKATDPVKEINSIIDQMHKEANPNKKNTILGTILGALLGGLAGAGAYLYSPKNKNNDEHDEDNKNTYEYDEDNKTIDRNMTYHTTSIVLPYAQQDATDTIEKNKTKGEEECDILKNMNATITDCEQQVKNLKKKLSGLENARQYLEYSQQANQIDKERNKKEINEMQNKNDNLTQEIENIKEAINNTKGIVDILSNQYYKTEKFMNKTKELKTNLSKSLTELDNCKNTNDKINNLEATIGVLNETIAHNKEVVDSERGNLAAYKNILDRLKNTPANSDFYMCLETNNNINTCMDANLHGFHYNLSICDAYRSPFMTGNRIYMKNKTCVQDEFESKVKNIDTADQSINNATSNMQSEQEKLDQEREEFGRRNCTNVQYNNETLYKKIQGELNDTDQQIAEYDKQLENIQKNLTNHETILTNYRKQLESQINNTDLNAILEKIKNLTNTQNILDNKNENLTKTINETNTKIDETKKQIDNKNNTCIDLKKNYTNYLASLNNTQSTKGTTSSIMPESTFITTNPTSIISNSTNSTIISNSTFSPATNNTFQAIPGSTHTLPGYGKGLILGGCAIAGGIIGYFISRQCKKNDKTLITRETTEDGEHFYIPIYNGKKTDKNKTKTGELEIIFTKDNDVKMSCEGDENIKNMIKTMMKDKKQLKKAFQHLNEKIDVEKDLLDKIDKINTIKVGEDINKEDNSYQTLNINKNKNTTINGNQNRRRRSVKNGQINKENISNKVIENIGKDLIKNIGKDVIENTENKKGTLKRNQDEDSLIITHNMKNGKVINNKESQSQNQRGVNENIIQLNGEIGSNNVIKNIGDDLIKNIGNMEGTLIMNGGDKFEENKNSIIDIKNDSKNIEAKDNKESKSQNQRGVNENMGKINKEIISNKVIENIGKDLIKNIGKDVIENTENKKGTLKRNQDEDSLIITRNINNGSKHIGVTQDNKDYIIENPDGLIGKIDENRDDEKNKNIIGKRDINNNIEVKINKKKTSIMNGGDKFEKDKNSIIDINGDNENIEAIKDNKESQSQNQLKTVRGGIRNRKKESISNDVIRTNKKKIKKKIKKQINFNMKIVDPMCKNVCKNYFSKIKKIKQKSQSCDPHGVNVNIGQINKEMDSNDVIKTNRGKTTTKIKIRTNKQNIPIIKKYFKISNQRIRESQSQDQFKTVRNKSQNQFEPQFNQQKRSISNNARENITICFGKNEINKYFKHEEEIQNRIHTSKDKYNKYLKKLPYFEEYNLHRLNVHGIVDEIDEENKKMDLEKNKNSIININNDSKNIEVINKNKNKRESKSYNQQQKRSISNNARENIMICVREKDWGKYLKYKEEINNRIFTNQVSKYENYLEKTPYLQEWNLHRLYVNGIVDEIKDENLKMDLEKDPQETYNTCMPKVINQLDQLGKKIEMSSDYNKRKQQAENNGKKYGLDFNNSNNAKMGLNDS